MSEVTLYTLHSYTLPPIIHAAQRSTLDQLNPDPSNVTPYNHQPSTHSQHLLLILLSLPPPPFPRPPAHPSSRASLPRRPLPILFLLLRVTCSIFLSGAGALQGHNPRPQTPDFAP